MVADGVQPLGTVFKNTAGVKSFIIRFDSDSASLAIDFECREGEKLESSSLPSHCVVIFHLG